MKALTDTLWDKIEELNTKHKETTTAIYAIINEVDSVPHAHVGYVIRTKRKERKMTQDEMSQKVGCSRNYLAQIEKMERVDVVSFGIVTEIAAALDMNLYELVN